MITSREDYEFYLEADKIALNNIENIPFLEKDLYPLKYFQDVYKFQRLLRKLEYYLNCKKSIFYKPLRVYLRWSFARLSQRLGFVIHPNVFGPGLSIAYPGSIIVNIDARVGENCRIHNNVHIATSTYFESSVPHIGDNVFIGPGAVIVGDIRIADNIAIGANSFVNKSFLEEGITIAGAPARKISDKGFDSCYRRSTEILRARIQNQTAPSKL
jgi:serine O-acetyltransferase